LETGDRTQRRERKLDLAARAAWLYYVAGNTQDEVAEKLSLSRQAAQRLVALAVGEKLIKFRLDHPLAEAVALGEALRERFGLVCCAVEPADPATEATTASVAIGAADLLASYLARREPLVIAFSTGRTLRAMAAELPAMSCPQHKLVSLIGAVSHEGRAGGFEVVMRLAERTGAECYPMPTPVIASSAEEKHLLQTQRSYAVIRDLVRDATAAFVGIGQIGWGAPLHRDGFVTDREVTDLVDRGAVGEIAGWAFDSAGRLLEGGTNERVAGLPPTELGSAQIVGVAGGLEKVAAVRAALRGGLITGLVTDERTAAAVLAGD
jgi:DNA-binding transcriptional regulator LsrR (DeoR family)